MFIGGVLVNRLFGDKLNRQQLWDAISVSLNI